MKLMKRVTALFLCCLMLSSGPISAFATEGVSDNDVVVETTTTTETAEVCEECGGSDAHTDTCSLNIIAPLTTGTPTVTTGPAITSTETTGATVSGNDVGCTECGETEGHLDTCSQYVAPGCAECGQTEIHAETCSLYEAPADTLNEITGPQVGDKIWIKNGSLTFKQADETSESREVVFNYETKIVSIVTDENGNAVWYEFEPTGLLLLYQDYKYVHVDNTSEEEPEATEPADENACNCGEDAPENIADHADSCPRKQYVKSLFENKTAEEIYAEWDNYDEALRTDLLNMLQKWDNAKYEALKILVDGGETSGDTQLNEKVDDITISVIGEIPDGTALNVSAVDVSENLSEYEIENADTVIAAFDIKLLDEENVEWQPTDGKEVKISIDAAPLGMSDRLQYMIHHMHNETLIVSDVYTVQDGKLSFTTDGFSVFVVTGLWGVADQDFAGQSTVNMYVGDILYFKTDVNQTTDNWSISPETGVIEIATFDGAKKGQNNVGKYNYCMVTASAVGTATLSCGTDSITINVTERPVETYDVTINDTIAENGCLVPVLSEELQGTDGYTYKWYKSSDLSGQGTYTEISSEDESITIYGTQNGVNVAADHGGKCWYKVEVYDGDNLVGKSDPYWVPYSDQIENGDFELPDVSKTENQAIGGNAGGSATYYQINQSDSRYITTAENVSKGTAMWWHTTGVGTGNQIGRDIEVIRPGDSPLGSDVSVPTASGEQFVELNCEAFGVLYQDVLTAPNTTLNYAFSHRARAQSGQDTMAVVIMAAKDADAFASRLEEAAGSYNADASAAIRKLLDDAKADGAYVAYYTTGNTWTDYSGSYQTQDGQYLSRFFYVSVETANGTWGSGNHLDGVSFDSKLDYTIEYYVNGTLQPANTETNRVHPFTEVAATHTSEYSNYVLKEVKKITGDTEENWGSTSMKVNEDGVILRLYYVDKGISITKKVEISDEDMTDDEKAEALEAICSSYTAIFSLKDQAGNIVATATAIVNAESAQGLGFFVTSDGSAFVPSKDTTYTIEETSNHDVDGYTWTKQESVTVAITSAQYAETTYVNSYEPIKTASLTITKDGGASDESFIMNVRGTDGTSLVVVVPAGGSVTITGLTVGVTYTVTEDENWAWRYTITNPGAITLDADSTKNIVTVTNIQDEFYWLSGDCYVENWWGVHDGTDSTKVGKRDKNNTVID